MLTHLSELRRRYDEILVEAIGVDNREDNTIQHTNTFYIF